MFPSCFKILTDIFHQKVIQEQDGENSPPFLNQLILKTDFSGRMGVIRPERETITI
ncbi:hypothetical protein PCE01_09650 [Pediococcus cellicola]|nr:hypothetical protein PCE01_09650 [Pediococcus cellicola]